MAAEGAPVLPGAGGLVVEAGAETGGAGGAGGGIGVGVGRAATLGVEVEVDVGLVVAVDVALAVEPGADVVPRTPPGSLSAAVTSARRDSGSSGRGRARAATSSHPSPSSTIGTASPFFRSAATRRASAAPSPFSQEGARSSIEGSARAISAAASEVFVATTGSSQARRSARFTATISARSSSTSRIRCGTPRHYIME